jgi:hypothetical protein
MFMDAPLPGASVGLGVGVPEPAAEVPEAEVSAAEVPAAVDEAVALLKVPLLTGAVTLAAPDETGATADETGTTTVVGTTEMPPGNMLECMLRAIELC